MIFSNKLDLFWTTNLFLYCCYYNIPNILKIEEFNGLKLTQIVIISFVIRYTYPNNDQNVCSPCIHCLGKEHGTLAFNWTCSKDHETSVSREY